MATECTPTLFAFEAVERKAVVACFDGGTITSNGGALLLGQVDRGLGLVHRFAACFTDRRDPRFVEHRVATLVGQRIFALALGYEDLNDHDELRKDPTLAVLAGKLSPVLRSDCEALAGKSTLNRIEHTPKRHAAKYHKIDCDGAKVDALLVDLFIEAHERPPREIVLDLDNTDIALYGTQEGRFFHGHYDEYCYLPLYVFCGRHLLLARQRRANVAGSAGAVAEVARIVAHIRRQWPKVRIVLRADSGFANDELMPWEFPRLCRGGSNSLTIPAVVPHASIEETLNVSRQAHEGSSIDEWVLSLPRLRAETPSESFSGLKRGSCTWGSGTIMQSTPELAIPSECAIVPRVPPLGGSHYWGRVAPPIAALSGSPPKAPGSAGGYLL